MDSKMAVKDTHLETISCICLPQKYMFIHYNPAYINKNTDSMVAILDFKMAVKDTHLEIIPLHLFTSKIYV